MLPAEAWNVHRLLGGNPIGVVLHHGLVLDVLSPRGARDVDLAALVLGRELSRSSRSSGRRCGSPITRRHAPSRFPGQWAGKIGDGGRAAIRPIHSSEMSLGSLLVAADRCVPPPKARKVTAARTDLCRLRVGVSMTCSRHFPIRIIPERLRGVKVRGGRDAKGCPGQGTVRT